MSPRHPPRQQRPDTPWRVPTSGAGQGTPLTIAAGMSILCRMRTPALCMAMAAVAVMGWALGGCKPAKDDGDKVVLELPMHLSVKV